MKVIFALVLITQCNLLLSPMIIKHTAAKNVVIKNDNMDKKIIIYKDVKAKEAKKIFSEVINLSMRMDCGFRKLMMILITKDKIYQASINYKTAAGCYMFYQNPKKCFTKYMYLKVN